jgi:hypothetical protein
MKKKEAVWWDTTFFECINIYLMLLPNRGREKIDNNTTK